MSEAGSLGGIGHVLALTDLPFESNLWQPIVLYAERSVGALEGRLELSRLLHIAGDDLHATRGKLTRSDLFPVAGQAPDLPTVCEQLAGHGTALLSGGADHRDDVLTHGMLLFSGETTCDGQRFSALTVFRSTPSPSISTTTSSPSLSGPTPAGVPVKIRSPGSKVITDEM